MMGPSTKKRALMLDPRFIGDIDPGMSRILLILLVTVRDLGKSHTDI